MNLKQSLHKYVAIWLSILLACSSLVFTNRTILAAVPSLDNIRVALFIESIETVPSVTISSSQPIELSYRTPSTIQSLFTAEKVVRVSLDQYRIMLLTTSSYDKARSVYEELTSLGYTASIMEQPYGNSTDYEVIVGPYSTKQEAEQIQRDLSSHFAISSSNIEVRGPYYKSVGTYASEDVADRQKDSLNAAGVRAYTAIYPTAKGNTEYAVWIGGAADEATLKKMENEAKSKLSTSSFGSVDTDMTYMITYHDVTDSTESAVTHYAIQAKDMKLWVQSQDELQISERYGREYRGDLEISQYNKQLAVINELPIEHYLYSVIGSEMSESWPLEALKAQAVAARTYALKQGLKYGIAHVSDTTYDQAYKGKTVESSPAIEAVESTKHEVLVDRNGLIEALYSANAGGMTSNSAEVWGTSFDYLQSRPSPDYAPAEKVLNWDRVVLSDGTIGYVRSDFTKETGEYTIAGMEILVGTENNVNVRLAPYVDNVNNAPIAQINKGDQMIRFQQDLESNAYSWIQGPYTGEQLLVTMNQRAQNTMRGPILELEVTQRGPSGRVTEVQANGQEVVVTYPDAYRSAFRSLPSTRFDIEQMNRFAVLSDEGLQEQNVPGDGLYVLSARSSSPQRVTSEYFFAMSEPGEARLMSTTPLFRFIGYGRGHGVGMSQWGAYELASYMAYDYKQILEYYFQDVQIVKAQ